MISTIFVKKIKISIDCCVQVNKDILLKIGTKTDIDLTITLLNFTGEAISNCIAYNLSYKKCHFLPWFLILENRHEDRYRPNNFFVKFYWWSYLKLHSLQLIIQKMPFFTSFHDVVRIYFDLESWYFLYN